MLKRCAILVAALCLVSGFAQSTEWPRSDIPPDPAVTFGTLSNGMRYAIMHNATPAGSVSVRFRIGAGSMQESDSQHGLAHFLEHMAFRGSAHVADGEIDKSLQRLGLRFGADTNASTDQDETVYQFDLPKSDDVTVDTALTFTREIATNLNLDPAAAKTEAGVVLSELALRDSPSSRAHDAELGFALRDAHATASPSGDPATVAKGDVAELRKFYQDYYRPERATLIIVGDIDPKRAEQKIKDRFADWKGQGDAGKDPRLDIPKGRSGEAKLFVETGARSRLSLLWIGAPDEKPGDQAQEKASLIEDLAVGILNRRLRDAAAVVSPPFTSTGAGTEQIFHDAKLTSVSISYQPGGWKKALAAVEQIRLSTLQNGVTQSEVDRAVAQSHQSFQTASAGAATRQSRRIVGEILSSLSEDDIVTSPQRDLATADADMKDLKAATVSEALRKVFGQTSEKKTTPLIFMSSPTAIEGGEAALTSALLEAESAPVAMADAAQEAQDGAWPYTDFGKPGAVVKTGKITDMAATTVTFANGVRLTLRPSKLRDNQVLVRVKVGNGRLGLPKDRATVAWGAGGVLTGGLTAMSTAAMQRALSAKTVRTGFSVGDDGFAFSGNTSPEDLNTQLQVITAYLTSPGFRPEGVEQIKTRYAEQLRQSNASPGSIFGQKAPELLHDGDKRWTAPTDEEVQAAQTDDVKALLLPVFKDGALDVTIVGDINNDKAIAAVAATLGALPKRTAARPKVTAQNDTHLPADPVTPIDLAHSLRADQTIVSVVWPTHGEFPDVQDDVTLQLLADIMEARLFGKLRGDGVVYSASVGAAASRVFNYGYIQAQAQLAPDKTAQFYNALGEIIADLKAGGTSADELERARNPAIQNFEKTKQTNEYWMAVLDGAQDNPGVLEMSRKFDAAVHKVGLADIAAAARKYLAEPRMIRLTAGS